MSLRNLCAGRLAEVIDPVNAINDKLQSIDLNRICGSDTVFHSWSQIPSLDGGSMSALAADIMHPDLMLDARWSPSPSRSAMPGALGTCGQWVVASDLPNSVLAEFRANMPVHSAHERLLEMIPRDDAPLPSHVYQAPTIIVTQYFWLLDLRDRLWAESKVLESTIRRDILFPGTGSLILEFVRGAIDTVSDGLLYLETSFPDWASDYRILERQRFLWYDTKHPLKLIQPYLVPSLPPLPDFTHVERAAVKRRTQAHPFKNVPSAVSPRVVAY